MAKNEPISITPCAVVGESHAFSASSTTGAGEAAVPTAGVVAVELAGGSLVKGRLFRWNIKDITQGIYFVL